MVCQCKLLPIDMALWSQQYRKSNRVSKKFENSLKNRTLCQREKLLRQSKYPIMEKHLYDWIVHQRSNNVAIPSDVPQKIHLI